MHHLYIGLVYNAPQRSTFKIQSKSVPTLDLLQQKIADISTKDGLMVIAGDFNALTGDAQDSLGSEGLSDLLDSSIQPTSCMTLRPRISEDKAPVCAFGKLLLNVCQGSGIAILNGRSGKHSGCFTCHTSNGKLTAGTTSQNLVCRGGLTLV